jgi:hypothetical protein
LHTHFEEQVYSKRIHAVTNPVARQFQKLQPHPLVDAQIFPIATGEGEIRRA